MQPEEIKSIIRNEIRATMKDSMKDLMREMKEEMMQEIEEKCDEKIEAVREEINEIREEQSKDKEEVATEINKIWNNIGRLEEYSRNENIIIRGIKYSDEENCEELILKTIGVAKKLKIELKKSYISAIHRLPTRSRNTPPPTIVRVTNRWKKEELIAASKEHRLKDIYITNQLTPFKYGLLKEALDLKRNKIVKYVWTAGNKIMARKNDGEEAVQIMNVKSLMKFGWKENEDNDEQINHDEENNEEDESDSESKKSEELIEMKRDKTLKQQKINTFVKVPAKKNKISVQPTRTGNRSNRSNKGM